MKFVDDDVDDDEYKVLITTCLYV